MTIKESYPWFTFNSMSLLSLKIDNCLKTKFSKNLTSEIIEKHKEFLKLEKQFRIVRFLRLVCMVFAYISIISGFTSGILVIEDITQKIAFLSGVIGLPIFLILIHLLQKNESLILTEAQMITSEIVTISLMQKYS